MENNYDRIRMIHQQLSVIHQRKRFQENSDYQTPGRPILPDLSRGPKVWYCWGLRGVWYSSGLVLLGSQVAHIGQYQARPAPAPAPAPPAKDHTSTMPPHRKQSQHKMPLVASPPSPSAPNLPPIPLVQALDAPRRPLPQWAQDVHQPPALAD